MKAKTTALQPLIDELDNVITAARTARLDETAAILGIARLDLVMRAHEAAAQELDLLSHASGGSPAPTCARAARGRGKRHFLN